MASVGAQTVENTVDSPVEEATNYAPAARVGRLRLKRSLPLLLLLLLLALVVGCSLQEAGTGSTTTTEAPVASTVTSSPAPTTTQPELTSTTGVAVDPSVVFSDALAATGDNYRFVSSVQVGGDVITEIAGVVDTGSLSAEITAGGSAVSYVITPDGEWVTDADGEWVELEGDAPVRPPLEAIGDAGSLDVAASNGDSTTVAGVLGPAAGTANGVSFSMTVTSGVITEIRYEANTGGEAAVVTTTLSDFGAAGTVEPPQG